MAYRINVCNKYRKCKTPFILQTHTFSFAYEWTSEGWTKINTFISIFISYYRQALIFCLDWMNRKTPNTEKTESVNGPSSFKFIHFHSLTYEWVKARQKLTPSFQSSFPVIGRYSSFAWIEWISRHQTPKIQKVWITLHPSNSHIFINLWMNEWRMDKN